MTAVPVRGRRWADFSEDDEDDSTSSDNNNNGVLSGNKTTKKHLRAGAPLIRPDDHSYQNAPLSEVENSQRSMQQALKSLDPGASNGSAGHGEMKPMKRLKMAVKMRKKEIAEAENNSNSGAAQMGLPAKIRQQDEARPPTTNADFSSLCTENPQYACSQERLECFGEDKVTGKKLLRPMKKRQRKDSVTEVVAAGGGAASDLNMNSGVGGGDEPASAQVAAARKSGVARKSRAGTASLTANGVVAVAKAKEDGPDCAQRPDAKTSGMERKKRVSTRIQLLQASPDFVRDRDNKTSSTSDVEQEQANSSANKAGTLHQVVASAASKQRQNGGSSSSSSSSSSAAMNNARSNGSAVAGAADAASMNGKTTSSVGSLQLVRPREDQPVSRSKTEMLNTSKTSTARPPASSLSALSRTSAGAEVNKEHEEVDPDVVDKAMLQHSLVKTTSSSSSSSSSSTTASKEKKKVAGAVPEAERARGNKLQAEQLQNGAVVDKQLQHQQNGVAEQSAPVLVDDNIQDVEDLSLDHTSEAGEEDDDDISLGSSRDQQDEQNDRNETTSQVEPGDSEMMNISGQQDPIGKKAKKRGRRRPKNPPAGPHSMNNAGTPSVDHETTSAIEEAFAFVERQQQKGNKQQQVMFARGDGASMAIPPDQQLLFWSKAAGYSKGYKQGTKQAKQGSQSKGKGGNDFASSTAIAAASSQHDGAAGKQAVKGKGKSKSSKGAAGKKGENPCKGGPGGADFSSGTGQQQLYVHVQPATFHTLPPEVVQDIVGGGPDLIAQKIEHHKMMRNFGRLVASPSSSAAGMSNNNNAPSHNSNEQAFSASTNGHQQYDLQQGQNNPLPAGVFDTSFSTIIDADLNKPISEFFNKTVGKENLLQKSFMSSSESLSLFKEENDFSFNGCPGASNGLRMENLLDLQMPTANHTTTMTTVTPVSAVDHNTSTSSEFGAGPPGGSMQQPGAGAACDSTATGMNSSSSLSKTPPPPADSIDVEMKLSTSCSADRPAVEQSPEDLAALIAAGQLIPLPSDSINPGGRDTSSTNTAGGDQDPNGAGAADLRRQNTVNSNNSEIDDMFDISSLENGSDNCSSISGFGGASDNNSVENFSFNWPQNGAGSTSHWGINNGTASGVDSSLLSFDQLLGVNNAPGGMMFFPNDQNFPGGSCSSGPQSVESSSRRGRKMKRKGAAASSDISGASSNASSSCYNHSLLNQSNCSSISSCSAMPENKETGELNPLFHNQVFIPHEVRQEMKKALLTARKTGDGVLIALNNEKIWIPPDFDIATFDSDQPIFMPPNLHQAVSALATPGSVFQRECEQYLRKTDENELKLRLAATGEKITEELKPEMIQKPPVDIKSENEFPALGAGGAAGISCAPPVNFNTKVPLLSTDLEVQQHPEEENQKNTTTAAAARPAEENRLHPVWAQKKKLKEGTEDQCNSGTTSGGGHDAVVSQAGPYQVEHQSSVSSETNKLTTAALASLVMDQNKNLSSSMVSNKTISSTTSSTSEQVGGAGAMASSSRLGTDFSCSSSASCASSSATSSGAAAGAAPMANQLNGHRPGPPMFAPPARPSSGMQQPFIFMDPMVSQTSVPPTIREGAEFIGGLLVHDSANQGSKRHRTTTASDAASFESLVLEKPSKKKTKTMHGGPERNHRRDAIAQRDLALDDDAQSTMTTSSNLTASLDPEKQLERYAGEVGAFKQTNFYKRLCELCEEQRAQSGVAVGQEFEIPDRPGTPLMKKGDSRRFFKKQFETWRIDVQNFVAQRDSSVPTNRRDPSMIYLYPEGRAAAMRNPNYIPTKAITGVVAGSKNESSSASAACGADKTDVVVDQAGAPRQEN
ncbi:unnamed protein product [Amoebophrya sp. A120]|nr:unnamed protein product [Amoebophrya sp. A120]|eukprot:GSA120T00014260001.1